MSRIHDALKRAEQERATSTGTHVEPAFDQPELRNEVQRESMPAMPSMSSRQPSGAAAMPTMALGVQLRIAARPLLRRAEWNPDPLTMLFFQDDDSRVGAEEFRTLRSRLYQIREKMPLKRLMVTSALPKEGKSFVAANLGAGHGAAARAPRPR